MEKNDNKDIESDPRVFYADSEEEAKALAFEYLMNVQPYADADDSRIQRPHVRFVSIFWGLLLPLLLEAANLLIYFFALKSLWIVITGAILIFLIFIKPEFVLFVLLYQKFAPISIRKSCLFEPSCSTYMLMAIDKYGFFKGFVKGIKRILRCHYPNGGEDYP